MLVFSYWEDCLLLVGREEGNILSRVFVGIIFPYSPPATGKYWEDYGISGEYPA